MSVNNSGEATNKRKLTIDFTNLIDKIYDKIDSNQLQEYLNEYLDRIKINDNDSEEFFKDIESFTSGYPDLKNFMGSNFEEFEDNVRNGKFVKVIELLTNLFRKSLTSGFIEKEIQKFVDVATNNIDTEIVTKKRKT